MRQRTRSAGWLGRRIGPALVGLALAGSAAAGEPPRAAEAQDVSAAVRKHFDAAQAAYKRADYAAAYDSYRAAWALQKSYDIAANLGGVELKLEKLRDAAEHLAYALRNFPPTASLKAREALQGRLDRVATKLGRVRVRVSVPGAVVKLNGEEVGTSPIDHEVFVEAGKKSTLSAQKDGYRAATAEVDVAAGASAEVALTLEAERAAASAGGVGAAAAPASGGVGPGGGPTGEGGALGGPVGGEGGGDAGAAGAGLVDGHRRIPRTPILIAGGATAGAALVTGVVLTIVANGKAGDAEEQRAALTGGGAASACATATPACEALRSSLDGAEAFSNAAFWSFVGAGAVGAATVVFGVVTRGRAPSVAAATVVTPGGGAVVVRGRW